ncbi:hypothetical protein JCM16303_005185 [Sporobolomyces ruberrimus]
MQCLWILVEEGEYFSKQQNNGKALRRFHQILDTFQDIEEDQYDFHAYCMRKSTLRAYIQLLKFEDRVRDHGDFLRAARGAVKIYSAMHDDPSTQKHTKAGAVPAETSADDDVATSDQLNVYIDKDPSGSKLLATTKPLVEALRFVQPLQHSRPGHAEVWSMSFEIYLRQGEDLAIETLAPLRNGS